MARCKRTPPHTAGQASSATRLYASSATRLYASSATRRFSVVLPSLLLVLCGCSPEPADRLIGRWQGRPEMQDVRHEAEKQNREKPAGENGIASTAGLASLLDPFDFTITLHFEDRQNVQMSINGSLEHGIQQGAWQVVDQTPRELILEIIPKRDPKAGDSKAGIEARRFEIVFSPSDDDQFRLTEVGRGQGSLVFRRQK